MTLFLRGCAVIQNGLLLLTVKMVTIMAPFGMPRIVKEDELIA